MLCSVAKERNKRIEIQKKGGVEGSDGQIKILALLNRLEASLSKAYGTNYSKVRGAQALKHVGALGLNTGSTVYLVL